MTCYHWTKRRTKRKPQAPFALKEQVAQRLAAHRARRNQRPDKSPDSPTPIVDAASANARASRIAAAVAERYAHSQSYRAFLAEQAENAIRAAEAAAEAAARNAQAVADAQYQLLADLDQWSLTPPALSPAAAAALTALLDHRFLFACAGDYARCRLRPHHPALRRRPGDPQLS